jgi:outer membrane biosynthesis protein TonB
MEPRESFRDVENLRFRFQMNNRLRLECLAAVSKVFRDFEEEIADDLLASIVFALPQELLTANGNGRIHASGYRDTEKPPEDPQKPPESPQKPPEDPQKPPESPQKPPEDPQKPPENPQKPPEDPQKPPENPQKPPESPQKPPEDPQKPPESPKIKGGEYMRS